jgi:hypothetical protein
MIYRLLAQIDKKDLNLPTSDLTTNTFQTVLQMVFGVFGGVALIVITLAGLKYVLSRGNPQETAKAKETILYALVGLGLSISAFAIVSFVLGKI